MSTLLANVLVFARILRAAGLDVHHGRVIDAVRALEIVGLGRADVRATLRSLLVHRHEDLATFDTAFNRFFRRGGGPALDLPAASFTVAPRVVAKPRAGTAATIEGGQGSPQRRDAATLAVGAYSPAEVSRTRDFAEFSDSELRAAASLIARLPWQLGVRRTRRWARAAKGGIDLRPVLRRMLMRGGEIVDLPRRQRREAPRRVVIIGDVSGSMQRYSRMLLQFAHALTRRTRQVEAFVFSTRLTRITPRLIRDRSGRALDQVVGEVQDWGGGTRIGEALRAFNVHWARRVMRTGPVVIILSDGWDRGEPALLARELARVRRLGRRLIWLNPLLGASDYEPLTRGMQAALAHVDDFMPAHNLASLEELANHLRALPSAQARRSTNAWRRVGV